MFIAQPEWSLYVEIPPLGTPLLGIIGLIIVPFVAYGIGRGQPTATLIAYVAIQGTMRRFLITDSGLPQFLVFIDSILTFVFVFRKIFQYQLTKTEKKILIVLSSVLLISIISVIINDVPIINAALGIWRSVMEGPFWLLTLSLSRIPNKVKFRIFLELINVLLILHLAGCFVSFISTGNYLPNDQAMGVFGCGGSNYLSIAGAMILLFVLTIPTLSSKNKKNYMFFLNSKNKKILMAGWCFLMIWGASRFVLAIFSILLGIYLILKYISSFNLVRLFGVVCLILIIIVSLPLLKDFTKENDLNAINIFRGPEELFDDLMSENQNDVNRFVVALYNFEIMGSSPSRWIFGIGPGMYRSSTGNALKAKQQLEVSNYYDGRFVAPMYLTDTLVEYGIIGLFLILFIPLIPLLGQKEIIQMVSNPMKSGYILMLIFVYSSLFIHSTFEHRGTTIILFLNAWLILVTNNDLHENDKTLILT